MCLFLSCVVVSIARYGLRLKNTRKGTGPNFILLKGIKFASNVIDSHLYNTIKDLEKNNYSEESKTALDPFSRKMKETSSVLIIKALQSIVYIFVYCKCF